MPNIKAIEGRSVHQIQSGQVISDGLVSAVKELVENSLDAHSTAIEVRFKNHGLDLIEVSDNGDGISADNFESVGLKHYTSKLRTYDDLDTVTTYGFRGEALSSLCALSILSVTTATQDVAPKGSKLVFETSGKLKEVTVTASSKGTTVSVEELFRTLPVRRRELERNIKREYAKVLSFLQAYAIVCTGVKFTVYNTMNGKKTISFSTKANKTTKENISNVFGAKTLSALMPLELDFQMSTTPSILKDSEQNRNVHIEGHISRPVVGEGRQAPDRQMFFVNSRPCILPQVSRAINEIYKSFNVTQSPFIFANMLLDTNSYDVNVSPDKRTILLHDQSTLVESLKVALNELFEKQDQSVPSAPTSRQQPFKHLSLNRENSLASLDNASLRDTVKDHDKQDQEDQEGDIAGNSQTNMSSIAIAGFAAFSAEHSKEDTESTRDEKENKARLTFQQKSKISQALSRRKRLSHDGSSSLPGSGSENDEDDETLNVPQVVKLTPRKSRATSASLISPARHRQASPSKKPDPSSTVITIGDKTFTSSPSRAPSNNFPHKYQNSHTSNTATITKPRDKNTTTQRTSSLLNRLRSLAANEVDASDPKDHDSVEPLEIVSDDQSLNDENQHQVVEASRLTKASETLVTNTEQEDDYQDVEENGWQVDDDEDYIDPQEQKERERRTVDRLIQEAEDEAARPTEQSIRRVSLAFKSDRKDSTQHLLLNTTPSIEDIRKLHRLKCSSRSSSETKESQSQVIPLLTRDSSIGEKEAAAEERLSLTIFKSDFAKMHIVGQFNLGFILAIKSTNNTKDLFIIDQHASDEKYNFERLQAETIVQNQPLVRSRVLELTAMEELVVIENLDIFRKNGFVIEVDEEEQTGRRCKLVSLPMSKSVVFDVKDLEELIHLVHDNPNNPSDRHAKVRSMFAMRACRSSIMIGKTLSFKIMRKVVDHMGELDKPWNCPHGRPTMRHVRELSRLQTWQDDQEAIQWDNEWCSWLNNEGEVERDDNENENENEEDNLGNVTLDESINIEDSIDQEADTQ